MFTAIGFETINADVFQQIGAFVQPPCLFGRIGYVKNRPAAKPERANFMHRTIGFTHAKPGCFEMRAVGIVLRVYHEATGVARGSASSRSPANVR